MTNVKDIIEKISSLEKKLETELEQLKQYYKQEETKLISELEKNLLVETKNYESKLIEKNKSEIIEFEKNVKETYKTKLLEFENKIKNINPKIEKVINLIKEKILSYGNR